MMKKLLCLGSFIAMILAAPGCDRNITTPEDDTVTRVLHMNSQTRTSLQGMEVVWEKDDIVCCVTVYDQLKRTSLYTNLRPEDMNGSSATIKVTCGSAYTPKYVIYPSSDDVTLDYDNSLLNIPVPAAYTMVLGNIPHASNIAVGVVEQDNVFLRNVMTLMKFEVAYTEDMDEEDFITKIEFSSIAGESISGKLTYDPAENKVTSTEGSTKLYLSPPEEETYFPSGTYYFPLPSITLSQGFKLKLTRGDNFVAEKSYTGDPETGSTGLTLERNKIVNLGKTSDWELSYENTARVIQAVFSTLDKVLYNDNGWPFIETLPTINKVCGKGLIGPYHLPDNEDAPFYFFVAQNIDSDSWRATGGAGRRFGGSINDYMLLPGLNGYKLSSVFIQAGTQASTYEITDNPSSGAPTPLDGGEKTSISKTQNHTFMLNGTEVGVAYRINLPTTTAAGVLELKLTYEKE